jgi:hypothetical protein
MGSQLVRELNWLPDFRIKFHFVHGVFTQLSLSTHSLGSHRFSQYLEKTVVILWSMTLIVQLLSHLGWKLVPAAESSVLQHEKYPGTFQNSAKHAQASERRPPID